MEYITGRDNSVVKLYRKLCSARKYRRAEGLFTAEGVRIVQEAFVYTDVRVLLVQESFYHRNPALINAYASVCPRCCLLSDEVAARIAQTQTAQGIFCICAPRGEEKKLDKPFTIGKIDCSSRYVFLCGLQDPGNIGTILRTADALGIDGVVLSADCPDIYSPKVVRATMGAVFRMTVYTADDICAALRDSVRQGLRVHAAVVDPSSPDVRQVGLGAGHAVAIGNEGAGLSREMTDCCSDRVTIRMSGSAESFNAATAASILMWELVRSQG